ncbi:MAG: BolA family protein [Alphaproteobacteria bacterium]
MLNSLYGKLNSLKPFKLEISNESEFHKGHLGYSNGNTHFKITIVSDHFINLSKIARHRLIYQLLSEELKTQIHALSITALSINEYSSFQNNT